MQPLIVNMKRTQGKLQSAWASFYTAAPLSLCCTLAPEVFKFAADRVAELIVKGNSQLAFGFDWWESLNPLMKLGWHQWIGATIFLWGWIHQHRCHAILIEMNIAWHDSLVALHMSSSAVESSLLTGFQ